MPVYNTGQWDNTLMRYWLAHFAVLVTVWSLVYAHPLDYAQIAVPSEATSAMADLECPSPISFHDAQDTASQLVIAEVTFERAVKLPVETQNQIASDLKQQKYFGNIEDGTSELEERVRRAWQQRGYFKVQVHGDARVLEVNSLRNSYFSDGRRRAVPIRPNHLYQQQSNYQY